MIYVSLGGYTSVKLEMYTQATEAYQEGEVFAVFTEGDIIAALTSGPNGGGVVLENPILKEAARRLELSYD